MGSRGCYSVSGIPNPLGVAEDMSEKNQSVMGSEGHLYWDKISLPLEKLVAEAIPVGTGKIVADGTPKNW